MSETLNPLSLNGAACSCSSPLRRYCWSVPRVAALLALAWQCALPARAGVQLLSVPDPAHSSSASSAAGSSYLPMVNGDGRFMLFMSDAGNLTPNSSNTVALTPQALKMNVYRRDLSNATTVLVSVGLDGGGANDNCTPVGISSNGQYALFESGASNLVPGDTNGAADVFVRDLVAGTTLLVSANTNGVSASGASSDSAMTPDGRFVAFASLGTDLVPGDTNGIQDVFVRDLQGGTTTWVSQYAISRLFLSGSGGGSSLGAPFSSSGSPEISPDGRYVAFLSNATNLVAGITTIDEVYVRDLVNGTSAVASTNAHSYLPYSFGNVRALNQVLSDDARYLAFASWNFSAPSNAFLFRQDLQTGATQLVATNGLPRAGAQTFDMTPDGRLIAFVGQVNTGTGTTTTGVYLWDAQSATTRLLSTNLNGAVPTNSACDLPNLDPAGHYALFLSTATNLTTNLVDGDFHLYAQELLTGKTTLVDATTNGTAASGTLWTHCLSADGRFVAFDSDSPALVANDGNHGADVFLRDLAMGITELVSAHDPGFPSAAPGLAAPWSRLSLSADGRYAAFAGNANGLLGDSTNKYLAVFVRDLLNGTTLLASADTNGVANGNGASTEPVISGNGRYLAFTSLANNLVAGDGNRTSDVFVRDLLTGGLSLISTSWNGAGPGNGPSRLPSISSDGRYVLFYSQASNLVPPSGLFGENLYVRDRVLGTNYALTHGSGFSASMTPDGHYIAFRGIVGTSPYAYVWDTQAAALIYTNTSISVGRGYISPSGRLLAWNAGSLTILDRIANTSQSAGTIYPGRNTGFKFSADERYLVYSTTVAKTAGDTNGVEDVYLYDIQAGTHTLISQSTNSGFAANGVSLFPDISADGRFVVYASFAPDISPSDGNAAKDIFLFDRQAGTTTLVSASGYGTRSAAGISTVPVFGGDGQTVLFQSSAMDLVDQGFRRGANAFFLRLPSSNPVFPGQLIYLPQTGQPPVIRWLAPPGKSYQVEFKNDLTDTVWQPLNAAVSIADGIGQATDPAPAPAHRFYRIVAY